MKTKGSDVSVYKIISIQKAHAPQGNNPAEHNTGDHNANDWHSYIIANGNNTIVGYRNGSLHEVKLVAKDCVEHLNAKYQPERSAKSGRASYPMGNVEISPVASLI